jgi:cytochrome c oxidase assembly protein subunit 15
MSGRWVPEEYWDMSLPTLRNFFENTAAVQFHHRVLATLTATSVAVLWHVVRRSAVPKRVKLCMDVVLGVTAVQVCSVLRPFRLQGIVKLLKV